MPDQPAGGTVDLANVPDYVETLRRDGTIVGYVRKQDLFPAAGTANRGPAEANRPTSPRFRVHTPAG